MADAFRIQAVPNRTTTTLPDGGLWLPVAPAEWELSYGARLNQRVIVGRGVVSQGDAGERATIPIESWFPHVYSPICQGLPGPEAFVAAESAILIMRKLVRFQDTVHLVVYDDPKGGDILFSSLVRVASFSRVARAGIEAAVGYRCDFQTVRSTHHPVRTVPRVDVANLRRSLPDGFAAARTVVADQLTATAQDIIESVVDAATAVPPPSVPPPDAGPGAPEQASFENIKEMARGEDLQKFVQRLFGFKYIGLWREIAKANNVDMKGMPKGLIPTPSIPSFQLDPRALKRKWPSGQIRWVYIPDATLQKMGMQPPAAPQPTPSQGDLFTDWVESRNPGIRDSIFGNG